MVQKIREIPDMGSFPYLLGVSAEGENTSFTAVASKNEKAALILYEKGRKEALARFPFPEEGFGNVRRLRLSGVDRKQMEYCLEIGGEEKADPYGRIVCGRPEFGKGEPPKPKMPYRTGRTEEIKAPSALRSGFLQDGYDWEGDTPLGHDWSDTVIYQLHVRGFTMDPSSGVKAPGTFGGLTEKLPYLKSLGITAVELLPVYDFNENGTSGPVNYWGYTEGYYFAPKSAYCDRNSKAPYDVQFKDMVKQLHRAGVEVILQFYFPVGTEPELAVSALHFWAQEYHVDGFCVMGEFPLSLVQRDPILAGRKLLNYDWEMRDCPTMPARLDSGFMEAMRRLLRGDEDQLKGLTYHIKNNPMKWPPIHYIAETNGFTLMDLVSYETKHNEENGESNRDGSWYNYSDNCGVEGPCDDPDICALRRRQRMNALLLVFLSQGVPLLQAGDEMGHTKEGNNNSWCQDNEISWLNWELNDEEDQKFLEFVRRLIAFRREHGVFRQATEPQCCDYRSLGMPDLSIHGVHPWLPQYENFRRQLGVLYNGGYGEKSDGAPDDSFYLIFNFHGSPHEFYLPKAPGGGVWHVKLDTGLEEAWQPDGKEPPAADNRLEAGPRSVVILMEKAGGEKTEKKSSKTGRRTAGRNGRRKTDKAGEKQA